MQMLPIFLVLYFCLEFLDSSFLQNQSTSQERGTCKKKKKTEKEMGACAISAFYITMFLSDLFPHVGDCCSYWLYCFHVYYYYFLITLKKISQQYHLVDTSMHVFCWHGGFEMLSLFLINYFNFSGCENSVHFLVYFYVNIIFFEINS